MISEHVSKLELEDIKGAEANMSSGGLTVPPEQLPPNPLATCLASWTKAAASVAAV